MTLRPLALCLLALWLATSVAAQGADPDPARYAAEIRAFAEWDTKNATPAGAVLFVGSSTIRLWPTADRFPGLPVINRGFGGSRWKLWPTMSRANEMVKRYSATTRNLIYADMAAPTLGADGLPRPEFFVADGLHLTAAGYDAWTRVLAPIIAAARKR